MLDEKLNFLAGQNILNRLSDARGNNMVFILTSVLNIEHFQVPLVNPSLTLSGVAQYLYQIKYNRVYHKILLDG